jgi:hypothetical protein
MSTPRAGACDETLKELGRPGQIAGELLRVALDGDDQAIVRLEPFDSAILSRRSLPQSWRDRSDRLVMKAVDLDLPPIRSAT